jgi:hypothetical protein
MIANVIMLQFSLTAIPQNAVVQSAALTLWPVQSDALPDPTYTITAAKITQRNPDLSRATGLTYDGINAWTPNPCCPGFPLAQSDISGPHDSLAVDKTSSPKTWNLTMMAQDWVTNPATNYGAALNSDPTKPQDAFRTFASMEHPNAALRPTLKVTYRVP